MKKLLLSLAAVLVSSSAAFASVMFPGTQVTNDDVATAFTEGTIISLQCLDTNGGAGYYFNGAAVKTQEITEGNLYVVRVQENGQFALQSYTTNKYVGSNGSTFNGNELVEMKDNVSDAAKFTVSATACSGNWNTKMEGVVNGTNTIRFTCHVGDNTAGFLNTNNTDLVPKYFSGAAGFSVWYVYTYEEETFPMESTWYRLKNKATRQSAGGNYLGYYPVNPWYIISSSTSNSNNKITQPIISSGHIAHLSNGDTEADIDGQLWQFIAGTGDNAGKYCMVNKAYPDGAISTMVADDNGAPKSVSNNTSRFAYTFNREEKPDSVAWFVVEQGDDNFVTLYMGDNDGYPYLCVAGQGQQYQIHRYGKSGNDAAYWTPERYVEEVYNAQEVFDAGVAELKAIARGCAAMKEVIGGEDCPVVTMPEGTTGLTMETAIAEANEQYAAYIAKFNNKWVTLHNNRRATTAGQTPWLSIYVNAAGSVVTNTLAEPNDDSIWLMKVESNKLRFFNRTTGYALRSELMSPADMGTGVRLHIEGTNNYLNMNTSSGNITEWSTADDAGSVWTIAPANYTFDEPVVSTKEAPRYYRILSDRRMVKGADPHFKVEGENRDATGAGEAVGYANLSSNGIYWRFEDAGNGGVKVFNLIDGYAMKGGALATGEAEDAAVFYLNKLSDTPYANGQANFSIVNSYALGSTSEVSSQSLNLNGSDAASVSAWAPTGDGRDCLTLAGNSGNGAIFYFIEATEAEIAHATSSYIAAVKGRINYIKTLVDDTENLMALSFGNYKGNYNELVNANNSQLNTIDAVNATKRAGAAESSADEVKAEVDKIFEEYIVGQHVQLWTTKEALNWTARYMRDNGTKIEGVAANTDLATVWTIEKVDGGYIVVNAKSGKAIGAPASNINMVEKDAAQVYDFVYNPAYGRFAIVKPGFAANNQSGSVHMSNQNGSIVNWSYDGIENSHWGIKVLADPEVSIEQTSNGGHMVKISGAFTENAEGATVVEIFKLNDVENGGSEEVRMRKAAPANATSHATFTTTNFTDEADGSKTAVIDDTLTEGNYAVSVPGAMLTTASGAHTRELYSTFGVSSDGTVTGIVEVSAAVEAAAGNVYYDLQGRRVATPHRGIYICNGKKVLF